MLYGEVLICRLERFSAQHNNMTVGVSHCTRCLDCRAQSCEPDTVQYSCIEHFLKFVCFLFCASVSDAKVMSDRILLPVNFSTPRIKLPRYICVDRREQLHVPPLLDVARFI